MSPKVVVIVLNWNGKRNTFECLESLGRMKYSDYEIIVVDNASTDESPKFLKEAFPELSLIANRNNLGFGAGFNLGIVEAIRRNAEYVFCLNNDVVVGDDILIELVKIGEMSCKIGGLCPMEYCYDDPCRINCAGGVVRPLYEKVFGNGELDKGQFNKVRETGMLSGPAMMLKTTALQDIGLFDETFFYGPEDKDIALRLVAKGYKIVFVPKAKVWHKRRGATGGKVAPLTVFFHIRNYLLFTKKHTHGLGSLFSYLFFIFLDFPLTLLRWCSLGKKKHINAALKGLTWHLDKKAFTSDEELAKTFQ